MDSSKNNHIAFANFVDSLPSNVKLIQVQNENIMQRKVEVTNNVKLNNTQLFTKHEIAVLEKEFEKNMYISKPRKEELAAALNIGMNQIGIWFQNKRRAVKRNLVKMQKTRKENVPPPTATTMTIAPNVGNWTQSQMYAEINWNATVKPENDVSVTWSYTSHDIQCGGAQNYINSGVSSSRTQTVKPQIDLALPEMWSYTTNDLECGSTQTQSATPTSQPEIDLALPETWGYTSEDFQCGSTQNQMNVSVNSNTNPTSQKEIDLALLEKWGYTTNDLQCDWTQNHIESGINSDGHSSTVDYDFLADYCI